MIPSKHSPAPLRDHRRVAPGRAIAAPEWDRLGLGTPVEQTCWYCESLSRQSSRCLGPFCGAKWWSIQMDTHSCSNSAKLGAIVVSKKITNKLFVIILRMLGKVYQFDVFLIPTWHADISTWHLREWVPSRDHLTTWASYESDVLNLASSMPNSHATQEGSSIFFNL